MVVPFRILQYVPALLLYSPERKEKPEPPGILKLVYVPKNLHLRTYIYLDLRVSLAAVNMT